LTITIPRPKLLLAVITVLGLSWFAYAALSQDTSDILPPPLDGAYPVPGADTREVPTVTQEELQAAEAFAATHPVLGPILLAQNEELIYSGPGLIAGNRIGVNLVYQWDQPLTLAGPWVSYFPSCDRILTSAYKATGVTRLNITIDPATGEVSTFFPMRGQRERDPAFTVPTECSADTEDD
jgi:hypothetical protein